MKKDVMLSEEQKLWWESLIVECADTGEKTIGYFDYLRSKHWKQKRIDIFRRDNHKCKKCGKTLNLSDANVHHKTYERVGHEWNEDLVLLCQDCHRKVHGKKVKERKKKDWRSKSFSAKASKKQELIKKATQ